MKDKAKCVKAVVASLKLGSSIEKACLAADVDHATLWLWRKNNKKIADQISEALDSRIGIVEDALYREAIKGNAVLIMFFLQNRAPSRWQDKRYLEGKVSGKVELVIGKDIKDL